MLTVTEEQLKNFEDFLSSYDYFFVTGHKEPDGDSIASAIGIASLLKKKNKDYQLLSAGPFKRTEIKSYEKLFSPVADRQKASGKRLAAIIVDCSDNSRIGDDLVDDIKDLDSFIIDHHKTSEAKAQNSIIMPESPATAFLIQQLYEKLAGNPDKELADILFFGICTDTGFFKFLGEDSDEVFDAVSRLVKNGAIPKQTYVEINSGKPFSTRKLLGKLLEHAKQYYDGKLIVTYETLEDTQLYGKNGRDSDILYSMLLEVENVEAVLFIRQETERNCTAGLRSKDMVDVSMVASAFGGGGHKNASGLSCEGKIEELIPKMVAEFGKVL